MAEVRYTSGMIAQNNSLPRHRINHAAQILILSGRLPAPERWGHMRMFSHEQAQAIVAKAHEIARFPNGRRVG